MAVEKSTQQVVNPFEKLNELIVELSDVFSALRGKKPNALIKLRAMITQIEELRTYAADATLAAIHLSKEKTPLKQAVYSAFLAELLAIRLKYSDKQRRDLLCAILTSNISFLEFQVLLNSLDAPLNEQQKSKIQRHPLESAEILRAAGINEDWTVIVEQHHEKLDGSGYPRGLSGDDIRREASIVALCEFYTAMIDNRAYRTPKRAKDAMQELYERCAPEEKALHVAFIKTLGVYPPGTFVRLANGEICIVTQRIPDSPIPVVKALFSPSGEPYLGGLARDCQKPEFKVTAAIHLEKRPSVDLSSFWN